MSRLIQNLQIKNFKSIRDLSLECDRINIFIGKPNAGKSNILEAISLLGAGYSEDSSKFMEGEIRYDEIRHLFYKQDYRNSIKIETDQIRCLLLSNRERNDFEISLTNINGMNDGYHPPFFDMRISNTGHITSVGGTSHTPKVKKYIFKIIEFYKENDFSLHPPYGNNLYQIIRSHQELEEEFQQFLKPNGFKLLFDEGAKRISIAQETEQGSIITFPFHLIPDTIQRFIFHIAAIVSNQNSVILFEEPESHSYPPYIYELAQHIVDDEGGNQYFIATHNPYLLTPILQEAKDVALFVTWFEDYQTYARRLSDKEVGDILSYGMDIFLNLKYFIPHEPSPDFA